MKAVALLIIGILSIYVYVSTFLFWYWAFKGRQEIITSDKGRYCFVFVGSLIGLGIFFHAGFYKVLFFIPDSWGGINEDGDFVGMRSEIAGVLALAATLFIHSRPQQLVKFFKSKDE